MKTINSTRTHECVQHSPAQSLQCPGVSQASDMWGWRMNFISGLYL